MIRTLLLRLLGGLLLLVASLAHATSLMENLGRGVVAVRTSATDSYVSWRILGTDPTDVAFDLYRSTGGGAVVKLNATPLTGGTNYTDSTADLTQTNAYSVVPIVYGNAQPVSAAYTLGANAPVQQYLRIPLNRPAGGTNASGAYTYSPNDCSVGDLDGDGEYEIIVKWDPSNSKDNSQSGYTGNVFLDAYKLNGTQLWRIDLGINIRAGAHYTQFQVYDLDGDGKAEVACKTAPGTKDGLGANVILGADDPNADYRNTSGYILSGPEYLTIFNGQTGANLATVNYAPSRGTVGNWGDTYGNRVDRFLAGVAYLDGQRPSLVMCRGYYTRACLAAWDWRNGVLTQRWVFDTGHSGGPYSNYKGQGAHSLTIGDVDGDGKDEIIYGAAAIDDNGTGLYTTNLGHGDALHMSDLDPNRPGKEVWMVHEDPGSYGSTGLEFRDAATGALVWGLSGEGADVGRGVTIDIDPRYAGSESWGSRGGLTAANGVNISASRPGQMNFACWWDGDLLREILDGTTISKWNWLTSSSSALLAPSGVSSNNSTKSTPNLSADILGDWREEVIWRESTDDALRIYTTTIPTTNRLYTLMHDRQYRCAIAWQNTAYNQPPHPGFFLGDGMAPAPLANIVTTLETLLGPPPPVFTGISEDRGLSGTDQITNDTTITLTGTAQANSTVTVTRLNFGVIGSTIANGSGAWSLDYTATSLSDGVYQFTATATDGVPQTGAASLPFAVTIDTVPSAAPQIFGVVQNAQLTISGTAPALHRVSVNLTGTGVIGTTLAAANGTWSLNYTPAGSGVLQFTAFSTDTAGNDSGLSAAISIDTSVPVPVIAAISDDTGASAADGITSDQTLVFTGTAGAGHTVTFSESGVGVIGSTTADGSGNWSFDYSAVSLLHGTHLFAAQATDGALHNSPSSAAYVVVVDLQAPAVSSIARLSPLLAATASDTVTFRVTFAEPVTGVDLGDFALTAGGTIAGNLAAISPVSASVYDVTVNSITGQGSVRLDLVSSGTGILDTAGNSPAGGYTAGESYNRILEGNGTWTQPVSGGVWNDNANWLGGVIAAGTSSTADFSTLDLTADQTVHLDAPRTLSALTFGDTATATAFGWIVDNNGSSGNQLTLAGSATITVNTLGTNAVTKISAGLAGTAGLAKAGAGTLVLTGANPVSGVLNVNAGILRLDSGAALSVSNANVAAASATLRVNGGTLNASALSTINSGGTPGQFVIDAGVANFNGGIRNSNNDGTSIRVNGGTFTATSVTLQRGTYTTGSPSYGSGFIITGGTAVVNGPIGLGTNNSSSSMSVEGGDVSVSGIITIANQTSSGRGGALRVTNGTFSATEPTYGIVLSKVNGANATNNAYATFSGGTSTVSKFTFGYDAAVNAGLGNLTVNGGTLYIGAGGIVKNATSGMATTVAFTSGTVGATADWATTHPISLSTGGTIVVKAANASDEGHDISFGGALSGSGTLTKTGNGMLTLSATNTYSGATNINGGTFRVTGSLGTTAVALNNGGTLTGTGTVGGTVTFHNGGTLLFDLANATPLAITGGLAKGTAGTYNVQIASSGSPTVGTTYTLATFASTGFALGDFTITPPAGLLGHTLLTATNLKFIVTGVGASAEFTDWAYLAGLTAGNNGGTDDPDGDGVNNLLEFILGRDPLLGDATGLTPIVVNDAGTDYPGVSFRRRQVLGGVTTSVETATELGWAAPAATVPVSVVSNGDGTDTVVVRSSTTLATEPRQFFRLRATLP